MGVVLTVQEHIDAGVPQVAGELALYLLLVFGLAPGVAHEQAPGLPLPAAEEAAELGEGGLILGPSGGRGRLLVDRVARRAASAQVFDRRNCDLVAAVAANRKAAPFRSAAAPWAAPDRGSTGPCRSASEHGW